MTKSSASNKKTTKKTKNMASPRPKRLASASKATKKNVRTPRKSSFVIRMTKWLVVLCIWMMVAFSAVISYYAVTLPDTDKLTDPRAYGSVRILDRYGNFLAERGQKHEGVVSWDAVPAHLVEAILATEDRHFYYHLGFDPIGIARAMYTNLSAGTVVQGGSTLTQQLAKDLFFSSEKSIERKVKEILLAVWLEFRFTKQELLTFYLNRVYLGGGTYGFPAAARFYFDKDVKELSLGESALLAGLLKAPSRLSPFANLEASYKRMALVLLRMVEVGYITMSERDKVISQPPRPRHVIADGSSYFVDNVLDELTQISHDVRDDIVVQTSYDPLLQSLANDVVTKKLKTADDPKLQAAVLIMDTDGGIRAMIGGRSYAESTFNRATQAKRQPGSAFKAVVYSKALQAGMTPSTMVRDTEQSFSGYRPKNYNNRYLGSVTLQQALSQSSNVVAVSLAKKIGINRVIDHAKQMGIASPLQQNLSTALGSSEVTLLELVNSYALFPRGGIVSQPYSIKDVRLRDNSPIFRRQKRTAHVLLTEHEARMMNSMLRHVIKDGTGKAAYVDDLDLAGKTGTTSGYRDAWFVGYSSALVTGIWVGHDDATPTRAVTGGKLPAEIFKDIMVPASHLQASKPLPLWSKSSTEGSRSVHSERIEQNPSDDMSLGDLIRRIFGD